MKPTRAIAIAKLTRSVDGLRRQLEHATEVDRVRTGRPKPLPVTPQFWSRETRTVADRLHKTEQLRERIQNPKPLPAVRFRDVSRERR